MTVSAPPFSVPQHLTVALLANEQTPPVGSGTQIIARYCVQTNKVYSWSESSTAADDGGISVIASTNPVSTTGRWLLLETLTPSPSTAVKAMHEGDSLPGSGGYNAAQGAARIAFYERLLADRSNVRAVGPVINLSPLGGTGPLTDVRCACYAGTYIEDHGNGTNGYWDPNGAIRTYVTASAANMPDVIYMMIGTNNASRGDSFATMKANYTKWVGIVQGVAPSTRIVACTIPLFYSPAAPTGGLAAANAIIAQFNSWLLNTAPGLFGPMFSAIDTCGTLTAADAYTDGVHLLIRGQHTIGRIQAAEHVRIFTARTGLPIPRPMLLRGSQASPLFLTQASDQMTTAANANVQMTAASFVTAIDFVPLRTQAPVNTAAIMGGGPYATGWLVFVNNAANPATIAVSLNGSTVASFQAPTWVLGSRYRLYVVCDYPNALVSVWLGMPSLNSQPNGVATPPGLTCLGMASVSAWVAGTANPILYVGTTPNFNCASFAWNNLEFYSGASIPSTDLLRDGIASNFFEGAPICAGRTEFYQGSEGSGTSVASSAGGPAGTLAVAQWAAAGQFPALWDQDSPGGQVEPRQFALADNVGMGACVVLNQAFSAAAAGTADDVVLFNANAPFKFRVVDSFARVSTNIGGSTLTLRDTLAGAGAAVSDALSSATTGVKRDAVLTASATIAKGGTLTLRRSDRGVAGEVSVTIQRVA